MKDTLLIGFGNRARQGKDTAVATIIEHFGSKYDIRRYAFGDELKREVNELDQFEWCMRFGIPYDSNPDMTDPMCQTKHGKQRALLQWYGTEYRRAKQPFYWVNKVKQRIEQDQPQVALISDVRFLNEYFFLVANKGCTVRVVRTGYDADPLMTAHISERELDKVQFNYEVHAEDLYELKRSAIEVFELICAAQQPNVPELDYVPTNHIEAATGPAIIHLS